MADAAAMRELPGKEDQQRLTTKAIGERISGLVLRTEGVDRLSGWTLTGGKKADGRQPASGIRITMKEDKVRVDVHIVAVFGLAIPEIARRIQKDTKELFEREFPKYVLSAVNVRVDGVRFDQNSAEYREQSLY